MFYLFHTHDSLGVSRVWRKLVVHYEADQNQCASNVSATTRCSYKVCTKQLHM